ncbi:uncharacterized protein CLUP02_08324 [Colletotrichum lupini]|uniref:Uncharacterized protein n=1 Tax=Colletotrichum lupini TaxID=145971 RepID=A0A9Q8SSN9_9PEZI|nr:uncharacterized protein CLUP02_08324 [Colletotrichum lupini]UQC82834.1 hypothetical protein CLUP02_08324 [Colletotrichum lupini]
MELNSVMRVIKWRVHTITQFRERGVGGGQPDPPPPPREKCGLGGPGKWIGGRQREGEGWHLIAEVIPAQSASLGLAVIGGVCALPTRLTGRLENDDRVNLRRSPALEKEASDARWRAVYCKVQTASNLWSGLSAQRPGRDSPPQLGKLCWTLESLRRPVCGALRSGSNLDLTVIVRETAASEAYKNLRQNRWASKSAACSRDSVCGLRMGAGSDICRTAFLQGIATFYFLMSAQPFPTYAIVASHFPPAHTCSQLRDGTKPLQLATEPGCPAIPASLGRQKSKPEMYESQQWIGWSTA